MNMSGKKLAKNSALNQRKYKVVRNHENLNLKNGALNARTNANPEDEVEHTLKGGKVSWIFDVIVSFKPERNIYEEYKIFLFYKS